MGSIDLDPATTEAANADIKAAAFFTAETNGFDQRWTGNVFLNPPGGKCDHFGVSVTRMYPVDSMKLKWSCQDHLVIDEQRWACQHKHVNIQSSQSAWFDRLYSQWVLGFVDSAVFVCFSIELLQVNQRTLLFPICFPKRRIAYDQYGKDGVRRPSKSPPHASCIIYLPKLNDKGLVFREEFTAFGQVVIPGGFQ